MKIAIVGCGYVSDYYLKTLPLHPQLTLVGCFDKEPDRAQRLTQRYGIRQYTSLEEMVGDPQVDTILNLTNPRAHYYISKMALGAGKHVYSEKPLAMTIPEAKELAELAKTQGLQLISAPCSCLSETAQTLWKALREEVLGPIRLVYAEMDDGLVHKMPYDQWVSSEGIAWPSQDEFEVGCTQIGRAHV